MKLAKRKIGSYNEAMRRKPGVLLPLEQSILSVGLVLHARGVAEFHGFQLAKLIQEQQQARNLLGYGTLYKALDRLAEAGLLERWWEDPAQAAAEGRPRRRFYAVTAAGQTALADAVVLDERKQRETAAGWAVQGVGI